MADPSQLDALIAYLQQQRAHPGRDALKQQLIRDGAPPELVDQAFARVFGDASAIEAQPDHGARVYESAESPQAAPVNSFVPGDPAYITRIRDYLEQHRQTYDREALRQKLISDGHGTQSVDLAVAQVYGFEVAPAAPPKAGGSGVRLALLIVGVFLVNDFILPGLGLLIANLDLNIPMTPFLIVYGVVLLGELIAGVWLWRRNRTVSRGLIWGLVLSLLPIALLALLFGICVALIGGLGGF